METQIVSRLRLGKSNLKILRLLELHSQNLDENALIQNLGDAYLLKHNSIFRNVRLGALTAGYSYCSEPSDDFQAFPFSQLESILQKKSIPFFKNVGVLEKLTCKLKDQFFWDDVSDSLKRNYVFHESCHAVARIEIHNFKSHLPMNNSELTFFEPVGRVLCQHVRTAWHHRMQYSCDCRLL